MNTLILFNELTPMTAHGNFLTILVTALKFPFMIGGKVKIILSLVLGALFSHSSAFAQNARDQERMEDFKKYLKEAFFPGTQYIDGRIPFSTTCKGMRNGSMKYTVLQIKYAGKNWYNYGIAGVETLDTGQETCERERKELVAVFDEAKTKAQLIELKMPWSIPQWQSALTIPERVIFSVNVRNFIPAIEEVLGFSPLPAVFGKDPVYSEAPSLTHFQYPVGARLKFFCKPQPGLFGRITWSMLYLSKESLKSNLSSMDVEMGIFDSNPEDETGMKSCETEMRHKNAAYRILFRQAFEHDQLIQLDQNRQKSNSTLTVPDRIQLSVESANHIATVEAILARAKSCE